MMKQKWNYDRFVMNINDKRSIIKQTDVFNDDGTFIENSDETAESGKELLQRKLNKVDLPEFGFPKMRRLILFNSKYI